MEQLLKLAFENVETRDSLKIKKGLRQLESLLVQLLLSKTHKRNSSAPSDKQHDAPKQLGELKQDAAFREFFRLQNGFQWNVASRLLSTIETLMGMGNPDDTDLVILAALDLLQGILLLHPPSKCLFDRAAYMNLLLDLLDENNPPKMQSQTLLVLVAAMLDCPRNTRTFEAIDGLLTVTSVFKSRSTTKEVKMRSLEFLYFYLMPETPVVPFASTDAPNTAVLPRSPEKYDLRAGISRTHTGDTEVDGEDPDTRNTEEKQMLLGQYLSNVAELVSDLQESAPFG